jgi:cell wall-associated NlpC family hydrolase
MPATTKVRGHIPRVGKVMALVVLLAALVTVPFAIQNDGLVASEGLDPGQSVVTDQAGGWLATFTRGSRTVTLAGPPRTFSETTAASPVVTSVYVRLLPEPFDGSVDEQWLQTNRSDTSPDLLAIAAQYLQDAPAIFDATGQKIAGDAGYGPLRPDGTREEGSDYSDYLMAPETRQDVRKPTNNRRAGDMDCSGYVRMVFGYRGGVPMSKTTSDGSLPRRAFQILESGPGTLVSPDHGTKLERLSKIQAGDLVFFDAEPDKAGEVDHVGIYLGPDTTGHPRFISSRKGADGPTMGDLNGRSTLDGRGLYADSLRAVRRI